MLTIKPEDINALIDAFEKSSSQDMRLRASSFEIQLSKTVGGGIHAWEPRAATPLNMEPPGLTMIESAGGPGWQKSRERSPTSEPVSPGAPSAKSPVSSEPTEGQVYIRAANLGTFYRSPKPGAPAYVEIGSRVTPDTEVCLIEVMKLFTPGHAGVTGTVRKVLVEDGQLVEFEQPMFIVQLDS